MTIAPTAIVTLEPPARVPFIASPQPPRGGKCRNLDAAPIRRDGQAVKQPSDSTAVGAAEVLCGTGMSGARIRF